MEMTGAAHAKVTDNLLKYTGGVRLFSDIVIITSVDCTDGTFLVGIVD